MSDFGTIKPLVQPAPIRPVNKDSAKKENSRKKKEKKALDKEEVSKNGHVDEYI